MDNLDLQKQINDIMVILNQLRSSASIPRDIEMAFVNRIKPITSTNKLAAPITTTDSITIGAGGGSFSITFPSVPTGTIPVTLSTGKVIYIPYY